MIYTDAETKLLRQLFGTVDGPKVAGVVYVGLGTPQDIAAEALERIGVVSRKPLPAQKLTIVKTAYAHKEAE